MSNAAAPHARTQTVDLHAAARDFQVNLILWRFAKNFRHIPDFFDIGQEHTRSKRVRTGVCVRSWRETDKIRIAIRKREREREKKKYKKTKQRRIFQINIIQKNKTRVSHPFLISALNLVIIDIT